VSLRALFELRGKIKMGAWHESKKQSGSFCPGESSIGDLRREKENKEKKSVEGRIQKKALGSWSCLPREKGVLKDFKSLQKKKREENWEGGRSPSRGNSAS